MNQRSLENLPRIKIAILGPDGAGKSTIIKHIQPNFQIVEYFHLKPIRPSVSQENLRTVEDPHKEPPYSFSKSTIKLFYLMFQYNLGWLKNIKSHKKPDSLIVFDRYFDDLLVDSRRYRYGGSIKMANVIRKLIPRPDVYFILTADPEIIYSRKQEVSFEELQRQISSYRALADGKRYFNIDVNRTPEQITEEILLILKRF